MAAIVQIRIPKSDGPTADEKERHLLANLATLPSVIVALSGGADSAYLAWAAQKALGNRALSVTALSPSYSIHDRNIVEELVKRKMPASLTLIDSPGGKLETAALIEECAAILDKAGVKVAINTDDFITESRFILRTGAIAVRGGMSEDSALKALTMLACRAAGVAGACVARMRRRAEEASWRQAAGVRPTTSAISAKE